MRTRFILYDLIETTFSLCTLLDLCSGQCKVRQARKTWRGRQSNASVLLPQCHAWCWSHASWRCKLATQVVTFEKGE
ncbi:uncharacterized protein K444DRAFT_359492 [Hyaloscypha bicolor E]|uniref:Uncharacterized protein n=1 Tax=Hyaloscypha bicolor E TaxID=1095630 RepID=A0A2J6TG18_9HELO|nr:uncharacterized protein K444DRAFT_359492 [Hyaloscypha bicolor E]PMD61962.1 hypothetical protein K444DRAFT_359492 [Hyaloscypha bicolor E]